LHSLCSSAPAGDGSDLDHEWRRDEPRGPTDRDVHLVEATRQPLVNVWAFGSTSETKKAAFVLITG